MSRFCKLCGLDDTTEGFKSPLKKMCLNCMAFSEDDSDVCACTNEKVLEKGKKKILENVPDGYEVENITLSRMVLKDPTKKCAEYHPNAELIIEEVGKIFGFVEDPNAANPEKVSPEK